MNQNGKPISAYIWDPEEEEHNLSVVPNCLEFVNNYFNLQICDFMFSRSSQSKHSLVI